MNDVCVVVFNLDAVMGMTVTTIIKVFLISILPSLLFVRYVTAGFTWSPGCPRGPSDVSHLWLVVYLASARTALCSL